MQQDTYRFLAGRVPGVVKERRKANADRLSRLRRDRRRIRKALSALATLGLLEDEAQSRRDLHALCELMVDYVSFAHYGIFWRINNGEERRQKAKEAAKTIYPRLQNSTNQLVKFARHYQGLDHLRKVRKRLPKELGDLRKHLDQRFRYEDELIRSLSEYRDSAKSGELAKAA